MASPMREMYFLYMKNKNHDLILFFILFFMSQNVNVRCSKHIKNIRLNVKLVFLAVCIFDSDSNKVTIKLRSCFNAATYINKSYVVLCFYLCFFYFVGTKIEKQTVWVICYIDAFVILFDKQYPKQIDCYNLF